MISCIMVVKTLSVLHATWDRASPRPWPCCSAPVDPSAAMRPSGPSGHRRLDPTTVLRLSPLHLVVLESCMRPTAHWIRCTCWGHVIDGHDALLLEAGNGVVATDGNLELMGTWRSSRTNLIRSCFLLLATFYGSASASEVSSPWPLDWDSSHELLEAPRS